MTIYNLDITQIKEKTKALKTRVVFADGCYYAITQEVTLSDYQEGIGCLEVVSFGCPYAKNVITGGFSRVSNAKLNKFNELLNEYKSHFKRFDSNIESYNREVAHILM